MATTTVSDTIYSDKTSTGWRLKISYTITQTDTNKTNNQSVVKQTLYVYNGTTGSYNNDGDAYYKLYNNTINNFKYSYGDSCDWHKLGERSDTITHDNSGSKTIYLSATWCSAISTSQWTPYSITISSTAVSLPKIARASSITSASNVTLGSACSVKWTPASKSFYYKLKFVVGTKTYTTGALHPDTTSAYTYKSYTMTLDDYIAQMSKSSATCNLTLYTYSDSACTTKVGTETTGSFTVSLPSSAKPTVGALHYDYSADDSYSQQKQIFVQNHSKVRLYIDNVAQGFRGSEITKYIITGDLPNVSKIERESYPSLDNPTKTDVFTTAGTKTFYIQVEDSRGVLSDKQSVSINVLPYNTPSIQIKSLDRTVDGGEVQISYSATYSSLNNNNNISSIEVYRKINGQNYSSTAYSTITGNVSSTGTIIIPGCEDTSSYYFKLKIKDSAYNSISNFSNEGFINVASRLVNFGSQGNSVAFGKISEKTNALEVSDKWDTYINGSLTLGGHNSSIGSILTATSTTKTVAGSTVVNLTSLEIPAGTWLVIGGFYTGNFSSETVTGRFRISLTTEGTNASVALNPANNNGYGTNVYTPYGSKVALYGEVITIRSNDSAYTVYLDAYHSCNDSISTTGQIKAVRIA